VRAPDHGEYRQVAQGFGFVSAVGKHALSFSSATAVAGFVLTAALPRNENKKEISETGRKPKTSI
jgi:hypothetical protein